MNLKAAKRLQSHITLNVLIKTKTKYKIFTFVLGIPGTTNSAAGSVI
jgi:hypothetical protein